MQLQSKKIRPLGQHRYRWRFALLPITMKDDEFRIEGSSSRIWLEPYRVRQTYGEFGSNSAFVVKLWVTDRRWTREEFEQLQLDGGTANC